MSYKVTIEHRDIPKTTTLDRYRQALEDIANGNWPAHYNNDGDERNWCQVRAMSALEDNE